MPRDKARDPIADKLRELRTATGLSLEGIEDKSGGQFKDVVVGSWERGDRQPTIGKLRALLNWYGYDLAVVRKDAPSGEVLAEVTARLTEALEMLAVKPS